MKIKWLELTMFRAKTIFNQSRHDVLRRIGFEVSSSTISSGYVTRPTKKSVIDMT